MTESQITKRLMRLAIRGQSKTTLVLKENHVRPEDQKEHDLLSEKLKRLIRLRQRS